MYLHRNFSSSRLVRLLAELEGELEGACAAQAAAPGNDFAEKLSRWVGVFEAGTLHAAHQDFAAVVPHSAARALQTANTGLGKQLRQTRAILTQAITASGSPDNGARRSRPPLEKLEQHEAAAQVEPDFAPYGQRYLNQQSNMDSMIGQLRDSVRRDLSGASPELRQLAALDAAWEQMLLAREQKLLSALPLRLKRRFEQLRKANQPPHDGPPDAAHATWRHDFAKELQQVLLAELDVRLEPVTGLIEAFEQESQKYR